MSSLCSEQSSSSSSTPLFKNHQGGLLRSKTTAFNRNPDLLQKKSTHSIHLQIDKKDIKAILKLSTKILGNKIKEKKH